MSLTDKIQQILVVSVTPYFLEKQVFWFQENLDQILQSAKTQQFFQDNTEFLHMGQSKNVSELLHKLDAMGYEKVFQVQDQGEFSQTGGVIDIFPVNTLSALRLDFLGNTLENITSLDIAIKDEQKSRDVLRKKLKSQKLFSDLKNLKPGDYLTHLDHGVAKFAGIKKIDEEEFYALEYAAQDKLFVPVGLERKLSRYVGFVNPVVSRLGSSIWQKTKRAIKENVEKLAKELLALYANKEIISRKPYEIDKEMLAQLQAGFLHQETPDQLQAIEDIAKDLQQEKPMDRIVCGDVGFGKTEIAMRSALMAAANNYQVAIICPTTILANQHFQNFKQRFAKLPVTIAVLSRLQTAKEQKEVIKQIAEGKVDIVIGTHRVLSNSITFKRLQMLIIDDEQRFGVKQKEKLRGKNPALDLLSLSATPIPRTIYLALSSFKNISLMQTPPLGRTRITTQIAPYSKLKIKEAVEFELARGGQVYFFHNRVASIEKTKEKLEKLLCCRNRNCESYSTARIAIIHGRMTEHQILKAMDDFTNKKIDILVATTIIENGIDLPNVNTIIVEDASRLGLAQAYQIRGRVGRSHIKSFAYFFHPAHMAELAKPDKSQRHFDGPVTILPKAGLVGERLRALGEAKELGAGYQIAIKDLELRGAGNILGKEQSGSINKIGLNLYCQMLAESVEKMRQ